MSGDDQGGRVWYRTSAGRMLVGGYLLLALVGMALSVEGITTMLSEGGQFGSILATPETSTQPTGGYAIDDVTVPFIVYFYGLLGAMSYIFVSFVTNPDLDAQVVADALREQGIETDRDLLVTENDELGRVLGSNDLADELQQATARLWATMPTAGGPITARRVSTITEEIDVSHLEKTTAEIWKIGFRIPAALLLAAGAYLLIFQPLSADVDALGTDTALGGLSFLVGLYVKPAHEAVGRLADRLLAAFSAKGETGPIEQAISIVPERSWYDDSIGVALVVAYLALTLAAVVVSVSGGVNEAFPESIFAEATIPVEVYFYGFLGAMAYVFTSLLNEFNKDVRRLLQTGLRIPAALLLAVGVYLLGRFFVSETDVDTMARLAFLVGLYVKLTLQSLGTLADSLLSNVK